MKRKLIVTHHAPDLDAIGAVWMLKRFDNQHYGAAKIAFVNPGSQLSTQEIQELGFVEEDTTHVDTGMGEFDHHQPERGQQHISATSLCFDHVCQVHPEYENDKALAFLSEFITDVDHFGEIHWPEIENPRYSLMIHELISGIEHTDPHDDDSQLQFGFQCLDSAYGTLTSRFRAEEIIEHEGIEFELPIGKCLGLETSNDDTIKIAQKDGYQLVVRKDPKIGNIRIKARPDTTNFDLKPLADKIKQIDNIGSWFYHPSGKMLLNGSNKHQDQAASPLPLKEVIAIIKEVYDSN